MKSPRRAVALLACAAMGLSACTGDSSRAEDAEPTGSATQGSKDTPAARTALTALDDEYPSMKWNEPLPKDVTEQELQSLLDAGRLPQAEAHGAYFETMTNAYKATEETPDVVVLGDSMTQQGVDPQVLAEGLSTATGEDVTAFNAASSRARWGINQMMAKYMIRLDKVPDVVIMSISTRAAEDDAFYYDDVDSTAFSSVVEGCDRPRSQTWTAEDARDCRADVDDLRVRYSESGSQVTRAQEGKMPATSMSIEDKGHLRSDGFVIHPSMSEEDVEQRSEKRMDRGFPGFPTTHERAIQDFGETAELLREQGATVIATEIPYSPPRQADLEESGDYDTRRQEAARTITSENDVDHYPVSKFGSWWGDGDSRDEIHLAPQGAREFTQQLLRDTPGFREAVLAGLE